MDFDEHWSEDDTEPLIERMQCCHCLRYFSQLSVLDEFLYCVDCIEEICQENQFEIY